MVASHFQIYVNSWGALDQIRQSCRCGRGPGRTGRLCHSGVYFTEGDTLINTEGAAVLILDNKTIENTTIQSIFINI